MKTIRFEIEGVTPLLVHNGQLADPTNHYAKSLAAISGKRKKTEDDYLKMSRIEWEGGLYLDDNKRPIIPGEVIESTLVNAGKKNRMGDAFKAGVFSDGTWLIKHDGPDSIESLWSERRFIDKRGVRIGNKRIVRTRPRFFPWALAFDVTYMPDLLNESQVIEAVSLAGHIVGMCDYRPKFGRYIMTKHAAAAETI